MVYVWKWGVIVMMILQPCFRLHGYKLKPTRVGFRLFSAVTGTGAPKRSYLWVDSKGNAETDPTKGKRAMKIVTYNILGAWHGEGGKHSYAPSYITNWAQRKNQLIHELTYLDADIFCLQEVNEPSLRSTFIPELAKLGYSCAGYALAKEERITTPEPTPSPGIIIGDVAARKPQQQTIKSNPIDHRSLGCAIFCRTEMFAAEGSKRAYLYQFAPTNSASTTFVDDMRTKMNAIVMVLLRLRGSQRRVLIANTHLFWDPLRPDVKATQAYAATQAIAKMVTSLGYEKDDWPAIVFCGDFNAMPVRAPLASGLSPSTQSSSITASSTSKKVRSGVHELLTTGTLPPTHPEHPDTWFAKVIASVCPRLGPLESAVPLQNALLLPEFAPYAPVFTTKTNDFSGWLDHIWINERVQVTHTLVPPVRVGQADAEHAAVSHPPMPNENHASDHIPVSIIAEVF